MARLKSPDHIQQIGPGYCLPAWEQISEPSLVPLLAGYREYCQIEPGRYDPRYRFRELLTGFNVLRPAAGDWASGRVPGINPLDAPPGAEPGQVVAVIKKVMGAS